MEAARARQSVPKLDRREAGAVLPIRGRPLDIEHTITANRWNEAQHPSSVEKSVAPPYDCKKSGHLETKN